MALRAASHRHPWQCTVGSGLYSVTHTPLQCHRLHTVSGRFLSLSSLLSKHWAMMGFIELHMVCEPEDGSELSIKSGMHTGLWVPNPPQFSCLPYLLQVPEEEVIVFIQKPWKESRWKVREYPLPAPQDPASGSSPVTL